MSKFLKLITLLFIVTTQGCFQQSNETQSDAQFPDTASEKADECSKETNCLRIPLSTKITSLDPGIANKVEDYEVIDQMFLSLTTLEKGTYKVVGELAKEWTVSPDGKVYIFVLRQDVKWSDGKPVTAHDVVWAIQRNLDKKTDSPHLSTLYVIENAQAFREGQVKPSSLGVRALNDYTVLFKLASATSHFPMSLSLRVYNPLPRQVIQSEGDKWTAPEKIITNGPYTLDTWDKGHKITLKKHLKYYQADQVKIQAVQYHIVPDNNIGLAMYENDELDIIGGVSLRLPPTAIHRIKADLDLSSQLQRGTKACTEFYGFNPKLAPTDNLLVRKAIAAAIDKQLLIDVVTQGTPFPAKTITPPWLLYLGDEDEKEVGIEFEPKKALKALSTAQKDNHFSPLILRYNLSPKNESIATAIKTLVEHHLKMDLQVQGMADDPYFHFLDNQKKQLTGWHIFRDGWCADYPNSNDWLNPLFNMKSGYYKWLLSVNKALEQEFADLIEQAERETDITKRKRLYRRAEEILTEEAVVVMPLYFEEALFLVKPRVKGWYNMAFGGKRIRDWSLSLSEN